MDTSVSGLHVKGAIAPCKAERHTSAVLCKGGV